MSKPIFKTTPLFKEYQAYHPRFFNFHGWKLPLEFCLNAHAEHLYVRSHVGLFDISHLSQIRLKGDDALSTLESLVTNSVQTMSFHQGQYNLLCNVQGGIIDDGILYCIKPKTEYLFVGNGSRRQTDYQWIKNHNPYPKTCHVQDESSRWAMLALQGPYSLKLLERVLGSSVLGMDLFSWRFVSFNNQQILVSRTGYTGELGFELILDSKFAKTLWEAFLQPKDELKCQPIGFSARDTLRLEMKYPLYGVDLNENTNPHSAGLGWVIKNPESFIGSKVLKNKDHLLSRKWVGFKLKNAQSGVPRHRYRIFAKNIVVGEVTSGAKSPSLNQMIGLGYVDLPYSQPGTLLEVEIHQKLIPAEVVVTPFIKK